MLYRITTVNSVYYFKTNGDSTGILQFGRIKGDKGVEGWFVAPLEVGSRPVFITNEPCTLIYDDHEQEVPATGGIRLSPIQLIEQLGER